MLADISVDYLVRLEQGRDQHPSPQVLGALGDALQLTVDERVHLKRLSMSGPGGHPCTGALPPTQTLRPNVRAVLQQMEPGIASVVNRIGDVLAYTEGFARLAGPLGLLEAETPNMATYIFTDPRARDAFPDWDQVADRAAADLGIGTGRGDPHVQELIDHVTVLAGAAFGDRLKVPHEVPQPSGIERWHHPEVGELRLSFERLELPVSDQQTMLIQLPADDTTANALARLCGRQPGALRAVQA